MNLSCVPGSKSSTHCNIFDSLQEKVETLPGGGGVVVKLTHQQACPLTTCQLFLHYKHLTALSK